MDPFFHVFPEPVRERQRKNPYLKKNLNQRRTLRALAAIARSPLSTKTRKEALYIIKKHLFSAEEQYAALSFFYKLYDMALPNSHQYNPVSKKEEQKILSLFKNGTSKYMIAKRMNRHVSTIFYVLKRLDTSDKPHYPGVEEG